MFELDPGKKKSQRETGKQGVEKDFVKAVALAGGKAFKFVSENNRGVSDRIVIFPGQVWFVEIKRSDTDLTPLQEEFKKFILDNQLNHYIVYGPVGIIDFLRRVKENTCIEKE
jgi:hypothetical protein